MGQHVPWVAPATAPLPAGLCLFVLSRQGSPRNQDFMLEGKSRSSGALGVPALPLPSQVGSPVCTRMPQCLSARMTRAVPVWLCVGGRVGQGPGAGTAPQWGPEENPPLRRLLAVCRLGGLRGAMGRQHWPSGGREGVRSGHSGCCTGRFPRFLCAWKQGSYREWLKLERDYQCTGGYLHKRDQLVRVHFLLSSLCFQCLPSGKICGECGYIHDARVSHSNP